MTLKHISGFREAEAILKRLPQNVENRVLQSATMAGARVMRKHVKANAPKSKTGKRSKASEQYGRLSQNIKVSPLKNVRRKKGIRGARIYTGDGFWGMFLEFGTRFISARPWFRPAISESREAGIDKLKNALGQGIEREAIKLARANGIK